MSNPALVTDYGQTYIYYTCDRNPTSNEPLVFSGYSNMLIFWWNQTTNTVWQCVNNTANAMVWNEIADSASILSILSSVGWKINTARSYSQRSSPSFNTSYTPSSTNDTQVVITVSLTSTVLTAAQVNVQVNSGASYVTIAEEGLSGLAATNIRSISLIVPANSSYQLVNSSGSASIVSIMELTQ